MPTIEANSIEEGIKKAAFLIGNEIAEKAKDNLIDFKNVDTGFLLNSLKITENPDGYSFSFTAPYASAVEYGEKDPNVKFMDIKEWLKRKYRIKDEKELNAKAKVITERIKREGQYPKLFVTKAIYSVLDKYSK